MTIFYSFIFCGTICLIGQIILNHTDLTPGHITSLFVIIGSILGVFGLYDKIGDTVGVGSNILIISFGNILTNSAYNGFVKNGFLGLFDNLLGNVSLGISSAIIFAIILTLFTKAKD